VGDIKVKTIQDNISDSNSNVVLEELIDVIGLGTDTIPAWLSGTAEIRGLSQWEAENTGLEADDVTTLGLMTNYFFTDNISLEVKAGIPPKVDLQGKGKIYAPFSATAKPAGGILGSMELENNIFITDLEAHGSAASARAWTPAFELQYHFGKTGVNKFRPYVGLGVMYAYFNELEINPEIENDLVNAGHMIVNIKDGKSGAALERKTSSGDPKVDLEASDAIAPVATLGFTYDFNDKWYAVGSVSYAHLKTDTTITVNDAKYGELI
ncbi:OmpW/AlkL family protein, partial [Pseudomonas aeruginosa]